ncbi:MAG: hypothetical protein KatS3mg096_592 [Candidatus Parcubacteria bacterium]|nr:MAG: hypothetical protein KatS3mg096_592 [Candidatus Parcubacteria bacterium]
MDKDKYLTFLKNLDKFIIHYSVLLPQSLSDNYVKSLMQLRDDILAGEKQKNILLTSKNLLKSFVNDLDNLVINEEQKRIIYSDFRTLFFDFTENDNLEYDVNKNTLSDAFENLKYLDIHDEEILKDIKEKSEKFYMDTNNNANVVYINIYIDKKTLLNLFLLGVGLIFTYNISKLIFKF